MLASYLLCCAIIAATMGGKYFIDISSSGTKKAVVAGKVRYFGETTHMASAAASAVAVDDGTHEILGEGTTLKLYPECSLSPTNGYLHDVFIFNGGRGHSGRWTHGVGEPLVYTTIRQDAVNRLIQTTSMRVKYLDWAVKCPKAAPEADRRSERKAIKKFYSQITKITVSGTETGTDDREKIDAESVEPPKTRFIFDELSKTGKPEPWVKSYWDALHAYLKTAYCAEITSFFLRMSKLIKKYKVAGECKSECKAEMSAIYDTFIDKDSPKATCELNMLDNERKAVKEKKEDDWAGITPESTLWKEVTTKQITFLNDDRLVGFVGSWEYKAWLKTEDGRAYRDMFDVMGEGLVAPEAGIVDAGPDTIKEAAVQLDNNVYRRRAYDRYDVAIAYLRGYNNGLLERL